MTGPEAFPASLRGLEDPGFAKLHQAYLDVFRRIDGLLRTQPTVNVAIDGYCGSGKSTLASLLEAFYCCEVVHMDHFFLPPTLRTDERLQETGGNIDYERFEREVIPGMKEKKAFAYRIFDCSTMSFGAERIIRRDRLVVVEGSYSLHPRISSPYDLKIFLKISPEEQIRRIRERSPRLLDQFVQKWIPMENRYFKGMRIAEQSDLVIDTTEIQPG